MFVVSTGRTGTTFLAEAIRRLGGTAVHEPGPVWLRLASNAYVSGELSRRRATNIVRKHRGADNQWDVEASCLIYGLVEPILEARQDAYVVQLVRDPRTYVRSAMNWGVHRPGGRPLNLIPYRRLAPVHTEGRTVANYLKWARRNQFERVCWTWNAMNRSIAEQGRGHQRFTTIRMEDLFDDSSGFKGFTEILELAGMEIPTPGVLREVVSKRVNPAPETQFPSWEYWDKDQIELLVRECGDLAEIYGYPIKEDVARLMAGRSVT